MSTLKGTEASLSYVQCFLYLLQQMSLFFMSQGWIASRWTLYIYYLSCVDDFVDEYTSNPSCKLYISAIYCILTIL